MPLCGFNERMLGGLTMFAQGLYAEALKISREETLPPDEAFREASRRTQRFLVELDAKYYDELRPERDVGTAMTELADWVARELSGTSPK